MAGDGDDDDASVKREKKMEGGRRGVAWRRDVRGWTGLDWSRTGLLP